MKYLLIILSIYVISCDTDKIIWSEPVNIQKSFQEINICSRTLYKDSNKNICLFELYGTNILIPCEKLQGCTEESKNYYMDLRKLKFWEDKGDIK